MPALLVRELVQEQQSNGVATARQHPAAAEDQLRYLIKDAAGATPTCDFLLSRPTLASAAAVAKPLAFRSDADVGVSPLLAPSSPSPSAAAAGKTQADGPPRTATRQPGPPSWSTGSG